VTVLGRALFWPSKKWRQPATGTRFGRIGDSLGKHPVRYAVASGGLLAVLAVFALGFNPTFDLGSSSSASNVESAEATKTLEKGGFSAGATQPTPVVLHSSDPLTKTQVDGFAGQVAEVKGVAQVLGGQISPTDPTTAIVMTVLRYDPSSDAALAATRDTIRPEVHRLAPAGTAAYVGGLTSVFVDFQSAMNRDYAVVFPVAALIIMVILALLLRSLVAPWYLMVSVGLGFGATLGASVIVFQHLAGQQGLIFLLPIYIYLFVVALGTDYNILMVARLREEAREGRPPREAAAQAVRHAGPTVAAAGVILAGTFASLMLAGNSLLTSMGFAISFGIFVAAFVMAMFFTPALTALIGHAAWWPGHADEAAPQELSEV
jgi:RND superfamily putative drug exporter